MPHFEVIVEDQGHERSRTIRAVDRDSAISRIKASTYGRVVDCYELDGAGKKVPTISDLSMTIRELNQQISDLKKDISEIKKYIKNGQS